MTEIIPANLPLTPMLSQYVEIKKQYMDAFVFYRMGDFYELFFNDAIEAAPLLEVQLTSRDRSAENRIPMCGVPHHAAMTYVQKLLAHGKKVAICEQLEDPSTTKGLVRRDVTRVITPALIGDPDLVPEESRNYLAAISPAAGGEIDLALLDLLGSTVRQGLLTSEALLVDTLRQSPPKEILLPPTFLDRSVLKTIRALFPQTLITSREVYFRKDPAQTGPITLAALKGYLQETQKADLTPFLNRPEPLVGKKTVALDATTIRSLELLEGLLNPDGPNLFRTLDRTLTPMGRRLLKDWITHPLVDFEQICLRLEAVHRLIQATEMRDSLRSSLGEMRDLERLTTKTMLGLAMPRDLVAIREVLKKLPDIKTLLGKSESPLLRAHGKDLAPLEELAQLLEAALEDLPPVNYREGGIIRESYHAEVAELRHLSRDAKGTIAAMEAREKTRTGISSLKIKFSKVFGYTIEITNSHLTKVPSEYIRKQTIANGERFITPELKQFEEKAISAEQKVKSLEEALFLKLRQKVIESSRALIENARLLSELDVLQCFATVSREKNYSLPEVHEGWDLFIEEGRHPVVESLLPPGKFVPNSISLNEEDARTYVLTGPNMAGKSTIMRQVALVSLMAQMGCFVPAKSARIPLIDAIFTRIGSSDDLAGGRSTFMVEMSEVARILEQATDKSLILVDEIGRGTSTYDGLSLAWSIVEYIHQEVRAKTLFATHFHEITALEKTLPGLKNASVLVEKWNDQIVFLHRLAVGSCNKSYGIEVASLAHLPSKVLLRARDILGVLETQSQRANKTRSFALDLGEKQLGFFEGEKPLESRARTDS